MVLFRLNLTKEGKLYIKSPLREILNSDNIVAVANANTFLVFSDDKTYEDVIKSLDIIKQDLIIRKDTFNRDKASSESEKS